MEIDLHQYIKKIVLHLLSQLKQYEWDFYLLVSFASFTTEKLYITVGPEFGPELAGKGHILSRSVYGTKTGAAQFHESLPAKI